MRTTMNVLGRPLTVLVLGLLCLSVIGCGSGGDDDAATEDSASGDPSGGGEGGDEDDDLEDEDITVPTFDLDGGGEPAEFEEVDDLNIRFANFYWTEGEGQPVDVYWGVDPSVGELVTTIGYGEVSDYEVGKIDPESFDTESLALSFVPEGETDPDAVLISDSEPLESGDQITFLISSVESIGEEEKPAQIQTIFEKYGAGEGIPTPESGEAMFYLADAGLYAIEDIGADLVTIGTESGCLTTETSGGNVGGAMPVPPGTARIAAFDDANCTPGMEATDYLDVEVGDGDQFMIFAYGMTKDDRNIIAAPVD